MQAPEMAVKELIRCREELGKKVCNSTDFEKHLKVFLIITVQKLKVFPYKIKY